MIQCIQGYDLDIGYDCDSTLLFCDERFDDIPNAPVKKSFSMTSQQMTENLKIIVQNTIENKFDSHFNTFNDALLYYVSHKNDNTGELDLHLIGDIMGTSFQSVKEEFDILQKITLDKELRRIKAELLTLIQQKWDNDYRD